VVTVRFNNQTMSLSQQKNQLARCGTCTCSVTAMSKSTLRGASFTRSDRRPAFVTSKQRVYTKSLKLFRGPH